MAETAKMAVFHGTGKPFEIREYPVPEPEPGAMLIKIALANVCGSDMHYWRGEQDYAKMGRPLPLNTGHEHVGTIAKLGDGVTTDAAGRPLKIGDRVAYRYFFPCGRCKACLARHFNARSPADAGLIFCFRGFRRGALRRLFGTRSLIDFEGLGRKQRGSCQQKQ